ncbi:TIM barrel protein [Desulfovibrio subterraneus]|uniref:Xylose isomerase-like TIM barrel domain-containing protein n=1 Tax=Desulfovibrio subterraneus TaxID=2718620 RepID=A0A7J0BPT0_9BACT|nr:TIM barrel protein [Desulfovibrio subterraneus]GFM35145.1 hypothetical protein DSM101010T_35100 [Desulfovibrio subterraneus]
MSSFPFSVGLKLFSTNSQLIPLVQDIQDTGLFGYVELYVLPGTYRENINHFKHISLPFVIHAPHFGHGVNLANPLLRQNNVKKIEDARRFADKTGAEYIIVHGGFDGELAEVIEQVGLIGDSRFLLENLPFWGDAGQRCIGSSPDSVSVALQSGVFLGFVLDVGHAACASASTQSDFLSYLDSFLSLCPKMFHVSDGHLNSGQDMHLPIGFGDFPWRDILKRIPDRSMLTMETPRDMRFGLADTVNDRHRIEEIFG